MTIASLFLSAVVFILSFYGIGTVLTGWETPQKGVRRLTGFWARLEQATATVVTSFMAAVIVVWAMKAMELIEVEGTRGTSWGVYAVHGSMSSNAMIALGISLAFVIALVGRLLVTVPAFARLALRLLGESEWLDEFMEWASERRRATIAGAMWVISKIQGLFRW